MVARCFKSKISLVLSRVVYSNPYGVETPSGFDPLG